jgi:hypothetical protein
MISSIPQITSKIFLIISFVVLIVFSIAYAATEAAIGLAVFPTDWHGLAEDGKYWSIFGPAWGTLIVGCLCIVFCIMGLIGLLLNSRCLVWGGLIPALICTLLELGASIYFVIQKHHDYYHGFRNDVLDVVTKLYPQDVKEFDMYNKAGQTPCPATDPQSNIAQCTDAAVAYIRDQWSTMGVIGIGLSAVALVFCIVAMFVFGMCHPKKSEQQIQQEEWNRAANKHATSPSTASSEVANKV